MSSENTYRFLRDGSPADSMAGVTVPHLPAPTVTEKKFCEPWRFDGFPYMVTYLVPAFFHIRLLPIDWSHDRLLALAGEQARANRLGLCLVKGDDEGTYFRDDGSVSSLKAPIPTASWWVMLGLEPAREISLTGELPDRSSRLQRRLDGQFGGEYSMIMGDLAKGGRIATPEDIFLLSGINKRGLPGELEHCETCGEPRGTCLDDRPPPTRVVTVHCVCENLNRCASCGDLLAERKLNGNNLDTTTGFVWHSGAFMALSHECEPAIDWGGNHG